MELVICRETDVMRWLLRDEESPEYATVTAVPSYLQKEFLFFCNKKGGLDTLRRRYEVEL